MEPVDEANARADDDGTALTVAELEAYIQQLKRHIAFLERRNQDLVAQVQEYQRRELQLITQRPS